ncbi:hypothetical protein [Actinomadura darangshiensis]|uniref:hypothetical protein n=1 Tax=Actinomadura darangshiensis TaxID=705336 RepID=UPI003C7A333E
MSRVLNGRSTVDPELAERVRRVSRRLRYQPSATAQGPARGTAKAVGGDRARSAGTGSPNRG